MLAGARLLREVLKCSVERGGRRRSLAAAAWACSETPNPKVRKFEPASVSAERLAALLPGARQELLVLDGVRDVFIGAAPVAGEGETAALPWLAVTRSDGVQWETLQPQVEALLTSYDGVDGSSSHGTDMSAEQTASVPLEGIAADIEECLEARVRPSVQADGGDVELVRWDAATGEVLLRLKGACRGCPQSAVTLKETILKTLKWFVPEVQSVVAEEDPLEDDPSDPYADIAWEHDGEPVGSLVTELAAAGTPFFSTFAGIRVEGKMLKRVRFMSKCELNGRKPEHVIVTCTSCKAKRTIEDPQDILRADKGNKTGNAAVVICPTCCVLVTP